ncbi:unnamed protein product [Rangifer tarandus platyrhynchus]|uniref:Uncharacterized protein n=2 Tax=Rangifer tarandus platyrhynchus TaxID=3082113 RepID=A0ABN8YUB5_RANTA|nr:unnamed protein product [Rangifer tarandus platyrhynchus]
MLEAEPGSRVPRETRPASPRANPPTADGSRMHCLKTYSRTAGQEAGLCLPCGVLPVIPSSHGCWGRPGPVLGAGPSLEPHRLVCACAVRRSLTHAFLSFKESLMRQLLLRGELSSRDGGILEGHDWEPALGWPTPPPAVRQR